MSLTVFYIVKKRNRTHIIVSFPVFSLTFPRRFPDVSPTFSPTFLKDVDIPLLFLQRQYFCFLLWGLSGTVISIIPVSKAGVRYLSRKCLRSFKPSLFIISLRDKSLPLSVFTAHLKQDYHRGILRGEMQ